MEDQKRENIIEVHHRLEIESTRDVPEGKTRRRKATSGKTILVYQSVSLTSLSSSRWLIQSTMCGWP